MRKIFTHNVRNLRIRGRFARTARSAGFIAWLLIPSAILSRNSTVRANSSEIVESVRSIIEPTPAGGWHSVCVCSDGNYEIEKNLICSFPVRSNGQKLEIVQDVPVNEFSRAKIDATVNKLKEERAMVADLLPKQSCLSQPAVLLYSGP